MTDRKVKVVMSAEVASYIEGMKRAKKATAETGTEAEKLAAQKDAFGQVGRAGVTMGAVLAAGLGVAVVKFAEFDAAMSNVKATGEDAAGSIDALRTAAIDAGASTVFSATEAANAIEELAKAGVSASDILGGGLKGALDLAAAGGLGVAEAAGIAAVALKTFNLEGEDVGHVADLLAAGAGKAMGDVTDLAGALNQSAQVAAATGLTIDETTAALSAFASQGLLGSDAGTSFKTMLQSLTPQSEKAKAEMERLGISAYDAQGEFVGLEQFAGNLQDAMKGLTPEARNAAMAVIFGSDAVRAANVIYQEGEDGIRGWISTVDDTGYAARTAATRLDNLKGDVEALQGAFDTALIETGGVANDTLRAMVQTLTGLIDLYNDMPEPVKGATLAVGGATAAVGLAGGAALLAVPKFAELKRAMAITGVTAKGLGLSAGLAGLALGGLFAIVTTVASAHAEARAKAQAYADTLEAGTNKITDATRDMLVESLAAEKSWLWMSRGSAFDAAEKFGLSLQTVADAAEGDVDALKELRDIVDAGTGEQDAAARVAEKYGLSLGEVSAASSVLSEAILGERDSLDEAIRVNEQKNEVTQKGTEVTQTAATAYLDAANNASALNSELDQLIETINEANGVGQDAVTANLSYKDALAKVDEQIAAGATGWDANTRAGRDNQSMIVGLAEDAQKAAAAQFELDGNTDAYRQTLESSRQSLIDRATALGANADEAAALADQIFRIPSDTEWELIADTSRAQWTIQDFLSRYGELRGNIVYRAVNSDGAAGGFATGGRITGPGTRTSDSIPILASHDEHMLSADEVDGLGGHSAVERMRAAAREGTFLTDDGPEMVFDAPIVVIDLPKSDRVAVEVGASQVSMLIVDQREGVAILLSDTLVTLDGVPYMFQQKVVPLPNHNMVIAVLGSSYVGDAWYRCLTSGSDATDIETANTLAPGVLRRIWAEVQAHPGAPRSSTVYHFGFPPGSDKLVSYTYMSGNGFEPERFEGDRFILKSVAPGTRLHYSEGDTVLDLATWVRDLNDAAKPEPGMPTTDEQWGVHIGGELYETVVENWQITTRRLHVFDDYNEDAATIARNK